MGLLIGVTGAMTMHCANEMSATPPAAHAVESNTAGPGTTHHTTALAKPDHESRGTGGMLITCLAFLIAVITAMSQLRPGQFRAVVGVLRSTRAHVSDRVISRAPLLAELCLLRT
jgi:hypothetical protein